MESKISNFERKIKFLSLTDLEAVQRLKGAIYRALKFDDKDCEAAEIILQFEIDSRINQLFEP